MKVVVAFSGGTDSVAALIDSINKYGKENVIAYMIVVISKDDAPRTFRMHEAQQFSAENICEILGVELVVDKQILVTKGHTVHPDMYQWAHSLIMYCIANKDVSAALYGQSSDDTYHEHAYLWREIFEKCMKAQKRNVSIEVPPLLHLSKKQAYDTIPESIKKYVWTCAHPLGRVLNGNEIKRYMPCGKCEKCVEFNTKVCHIVCGSEQKAKAILEIK
jgi:7-cyano-7-deazaguanine synthase in queuosine biosynthesis